MSPTLLRTYTSYPVTRDASRSHIPQMTLSKLLFMHLFIPSQKQFKFWVKYFRSPTAHAENIDWPSWSPVSEQDGGAFLDSRFPSEYKRLKSIEDKISGEWSVMMDLMQIDLPCIWGRMFEYLPRGWIADGRWMRSGFGMPERSNASFVALFLVVFQDASPVCIAWWAERWGSDINFSGFVLILQIYSLFTTPLLFADGLRFSSHGQAESYQMISLSSSQLSENKREDWNTRQIQAKIVARHTFRPNILTSHASTSRLTLRPRSYLVPSTFK